MRGREACCVHYAEDFYMSLYNVIFTVLPPLVIGMFDQDVDRQSSRLYPGMPLADCKAAPLSLRGASLHACVRDCAAVAGIQECLLCTGLYQAGPKNLYFRPRALAGWIINAIFQVL